MNMYTTIIRAIDPKTKVLRAYAGPHVPGISFEDAQAYCNRNGMGYCEVDGILISEIPTFKGTISPDWKNRVEYYLKNLN